MLSRLPYDSPPHAAQFVVLPYPSKGLVTVQVILEEYGKWINETTNSTMAQRNEYYAAIVNEAESLMRAANNSNLKGTGQRTPCLGQLLKQLARHSVIA